MKQRTLVIIGCGKSKRDYACKAGELYTGQLFKLSRQWAEMVGDDWLIASARLPDNKPAGGAMPGATCGLIHPEIVIEPYDRTLKGLGYDAIRQWRSWAQADFSAWLRDNDYPRDRESQAEWAANFRIVILAGKDYVQPLRETAMRSFRIETPLAGLGIGERLQWLKGAVEQARQEAQRRESQLTLFSS